MKSYFVKFTETREKTLLVVAESPSDVVTQIKDMYDNEEIDMNSYVNCRCSVDMCEADLGVYELNEPVEAPCKEDELGADPDNEYDSLDDLRTTMCDFCPIHGNNHICAV